MTKRERKTLKMLQVKEAHEKALVRFKEAKPKLISLAVRAMTEAKAKIEGQKLKEGSYDEAKLRLGKMGERMKNLAAALAAPKADAKSIASDIKMDLDELMQAAGIQAADADEGYEDEAKVGYAPGDEDEDDEEESEDEAATKFGDKTPRRIGYEDEARRERMDADESEDEGEDEAEDEGEDERMESEDEGMEDEDESEDEGLEDEDESEDEDEGAINISHDGDDDQDLGMDDGDADDDPDQMPAKDEDGDGDEDADEGVGAQKMQFKCAKCGEGNVVLPPKGMKLVASEAARAASESFKALRGLASRLRESLKAKEGRMKTQNVKISESAKERERLASENKQLRETNRKLRAANMAERRMREAKARLAEAAIPAGILSASDLVQFEPHQWATQIKLARRSQRNQEQAQYGGNPGGGVAPLSETQSKDLAAKASSAFDAEYQR